MKHINASHINFFILRHFVLSILLLLEERYPTFTKEPLGFLFLSALERILRLGCQCTPRFCLLALSDSMVSFYLELQLYALNDFESQGKCIDHTSSFYAFIDCLTLVLLQSKHINILFLPPKVPSCFPAIFVRIVLRIRVMFSIV